MKRITGTYVDPNANGAGIPGFTEGDPGVQGATVVHADWLNHVQEEIVNAIEAQGITLNASQKDQLATALVGSTITAAQLTAPVASWSPTGLADARVVLCSTDNLANFPRGLAITGRTARYFVNTGSIAFTFRHEDGLAAAAERFACPGNIDLVLVAGEGAFVVYDSTATRWRVIGTGRAGAITWSGAHTFSALVTALAGINVTGTAAVTGSVTATVDVVATQNVRAGDTLRVVNETKYIDGSNVLTPKERIQYLQLAAGVKNEPSVNWQYNGDGTDNWGFGVSTILSAGDFIIFPMKLPRFAVIKEIEAMFFASSFNAGAKFVVRLRRLLPAASDPTGIVIDESILSSIADGYHNVILNSFSNLPADADRTVTPANRIYQVLIGHDDVSAGAGLLHWVKLTWDDYGPINHGQ